MAIRSIRIDLLSPTDNPLDKEVRDAWHGIFDSTAGTLGGLLETWAVAPEATKVAVAGSVVKAGADADGGFVHAVGARAKAGDA